MFSTQVIKGNRIRCDLIQEMKSFSWKQYVEGEREFRIHIQPSETREVEKPVRMLIKVRCIEIQTVSSAARDEWKQEECARDNDDTKPTQHEEYRTYLMMSTLFRR